MKYDSTKLEGVQLRDERALREVRVLHRKEAALGLDLKMTPKAVLRPLVWLDARRMWPCATPYFQGRQEKSSTKSN